MNAARLRFEWLVLLVLAVSGALASQAGGLTSRIDNQLLDFGTALVRPPVDPQIVIVTIDDQSVAEIGQWPWPRDVHAQLIDQLTQEGARLIVLDILFPEPSSPEADAALADAMERSAIVVLPHSFVARPNSATGVDPLWPLDSFRRSSASVGHVVAQPDDDGVLRRFDLALETDLDVYPHLAVQALALLEPGGQSEVGLPKQAIIPFHPEAAFYRQPAAEVIAGSTVSGFFKDKIVLIGATAQGLGDRYSVPSGSIAIMSGIGAQANLIASLRQNALISPMGMAFQSTLAIVLIAGLFMAFWYLPPRYVLLCAVGVVAIVLAISMALLAGGHVWFAPGSIMVAAILAYPLWSWRRLSHVSRYLDREAERLRDPGSAPRSGEGLDYVTAQVEQLRRLIKTVRGSLAFLQQVIEAAPDAIVVLDHSGNVEMLNERAGALFPAWNPQDKMSFDSLLASSGAVLDADGGELSASKGQTYLIARADIAEPDDPNVSGEIIALRDVSDLRRLDEERRQMLEFLSHDMRTPQVAIVGLTDQAKRENTGQGLASDMVARIRAQAQRTLKLADDFVQLARLERPSLTLTDSDIGALIEEACDRAYAPSLAKQVVIEQALPEEPCFARVDASLIARMLDNLIGNAIKYSDAGTTVRVSLSCPGAGSVTLEVADHGPGLSPERIADPFARFGAHSTHAGPSSGLGLALVKKVVDSHAGSIAVTSRAGAGTAFAITLPLD